MNKRIFSLLTSLAMITSMASMAVYAADPVTPDPNSGSASDTGSVEGILDTDILTVTLPTVADGTFDFNMDPQSLINNSVSGSERYTATYSTGTLFFKNDATNYSNTSNETVIKVAASMKTDVSVKATVSNADGLTYSTKSNFADVADDSSTTDVDESVKNADKHIYLAISNTSTSSPVDTALTADGAEVKTELAALNASDFEIKWDGTNNKYTYALSSSATAKEFKFKLTGATNPNANWTGLENVTPQIDLTWSVKEHVDPYLDATTLSASDLEIGFTSNLPAGVTVTSVVVNGSAHNNYEAVGSKYCTITSTGITLGAAFVTSNNAGATITITFSDGHTEVLTTTK